MLAKLPYHADSLGIFERIADQPWSVFLDSGQPKENGGRFDIIAGAPMATLSVYSPYTIVRSAGRVECYKEDPLDVLRKWLGPTGVAIPGLPFTGGAIGYFSYDLARRFVALPATTVDDLSIPEMVVGIYDWAVIVDHARKASWLVSQDRDPHTAEIWQQLLTRFRSPADQVVMPGFRCHLPIRKVWTKGGYRQAFDRVRRYIRNGDCYQINLAQRFSFLTEGHPWEIYRALRRVEASPFSAYFNFPQIQILSLSPERFLEVRDGIVITSPIKGTRPRSSDVEEDRRMAHELKVSVKDRAENLMIVDLLRNDLGKICEVGSIYVERLFELQSFASVHHLVSTIQGRLTADRHPVDVLRTCLPGGSITGAPKLRAMQIIEELEPRRRSVYCGALGYLGFDGTMDTNIAIRTGLYRSGVLHSWAGGGIVADSDPDAEYDEILSKARPFLNLVGVQRVEPANPLIRRAGLQ